jgi:hypothetical protein
VQASQAIHDSTVVVVALVAGLKKLFILRLEQLRLTLVLVVLAHQTPIQVQQQIRKSVVLLWLLLVVVVPTMTIPTGRTLPEQKKAVLVVVLWEAYPL